MRIHDLARRAGTVLSLMLAFLPPAAGQDSARPPRSPAVAILDIANAGMDPRLDYLSGIVQGILAFDLGSLKDLTLVDRRNLDAVLKEKELSLSALGQDAAAAAEAGRLVGADWLLSGEYVFLGSEVLLTLSLTEASTARRTVFRDRGSNENLVHKLAEQVALRLTGVQAAFSDPGRARSLVSLRDETPGSIALFSPIIDAEIFLDDQFVGYTTGDGRVPFVLDRLSPGQHRIRVHLNSSFGVVKLPEVSFHDWEATAEVEANKRLTLRDPTRHFNDILYRLIELGEGTVKATAPADPKAALDPRLGFSKELSFQDRQGAQVSVRLEAKPASEGGEIFLQLRLAAGPKDGEQATAALRLALPAEGERETEGDATAGIVKLEASAERSGDGWSIDWRVERTDIHQNMWSD